MPDKITGNIFKADSVINTLTCVSCNEIRFSAVFTEEQETLITKRF